jgi:transglutaminase-like putative cysteine protease
MSKFDIHCSLDYQVFEPTEFIVLIMAATHPSQTIVNENLSVSGCVPEFFTDVTGQNRYFRFSSDSDHCTIDYTATVDLDMPVRNELAREMAISELPTDVLHYLLPSRYCESDLLSKIAQRNFGDIPTGFSRVEAVCDWIKQNIAYEIGSSLPATTARDVLYNRAGVCRDFAHLGIAFCRALNIPARFVFGYAEFPDPPPDFHALFEAYIGGRWMLFDPTKMAPLEKIVRIGVGMDAKDVAFATLYGKVQMLHLKPLIKDHVEGMQPDFSEMQDFIGAKKLIRMG